MWSAKVKLSFPLMPWTVATQGIFASRAAKQPLTEEVER